MKTDLFTRTLLVVIAVLLACNLFMSRNSAQTVHANSSYTVETINAPSGTFSAQGQIVAIACNAARCFAVEK